MAATPTRRVDLLRRWTSWVPLLAAVVLAFAWGKHPGDAVLIAMVPLLAGAVFAAVHHAEVVAHKIGEPFGSLLLAVAVTVIEVGLIVMLMISDKDTSTLARDTVFAAAMICLNGIVGLVLLVGALKRRHANFNPEGTGAAFATVITLAFVTLVLPRFSTSAPGPEFTAAQLGFAAVASLALYGLFVFTQTVRHREFYLSEADEDAAEEAHEVAAADAWWSLGLLLVSLVAVVGLAKLESGGIEHLVQAAGLPQAVVGVVIALMVLAPESIAAVRAAATDRVQNGLNLAYGSAMASIGLTIPAISVAMIWLDGPLTLGLAPTQIVLLLMSCFVGILTIVPGRAQTLQGGVHLAILAAFVFLSIAP